MDLLLKIAAGEIGVKEIPGTGDNPRILEYQEMTGLNFENEDVAWCGIFANWCALQAGLPRSDTAVARDWLNVGRKTSKPRPGDVVVMWRHHKTESWKGHVGFFAGFSHDGSNVFVLGGNQDDEVNIQPYDIDRVLDYRRLKHFDEVDIPNGYLRKGDSSEEVKELQLILIELDYLDGVADAVFGGLTETALIQFQEDNGITIDGIYGSETRAVLETILN